MGFLLIVLGILLFISLVVIHEFGHFIAARKSGVEVEEFGIGFPPTAKVLGKKNGTTYTLNWLPLGGFVRLKGEYDSAKSPGSFGAASLKNKVIIMLAGVFMNLITAIILFTILALLGMPKLIENQFTVANDTKVADSNLLVAFVESNSPADKAGLEARDELISYKDSSSQPCQTNASDCSVGFSGADKLPEITKSLAGKPVEITYKRGDELRSANLNLRSENEVEASKKTDNPKGYLGISPSDYVIQRSTWSAPITAVGLTVQITELTFKALGSAVSSLVRGDTAQASSQVAGPVGIFVLIKNGSILGYQFILMITALISLTLAIMNALPIPALDGGRLFVTMLFRAIKKPLSRGTENLIHGMGFMFLMALFVLITIVDVRRFL